MRAVLVAIVVSAAVARAEPEQPPEQTHRPFSAGPGGPWVLGMQLAAGGAFGLGVTSELLNKKDLILPGILAGALIFGVPTGVLQHFVPISVPGAWLAFLAGAAGWGLAGGMWGTLDSRTARENVSLGLLLISLGFESAFFAMWLPPAAETITTTDVLAIVAIAALPPLAALLVHRQFIGAPRDRLFLAIVSAWPLASFVGARAFIAGSRADHVATTRTASTSPLIVPALFSSPRGAVPGLAIATSF